MKIAIEEWTTPSGHTLIVGASGGRLCVCDWTHSSVHPANMRRLARLANARIEHGGNDAIRSAIAELEEYFAGRRRRFSVPLLLVGTELQRAVWTALRAIPAGATMSYSEVARAIGRPTAVRAVARAVGSNPLSIFVPCHRVVGADGSLTGYAGGLALKRQLLLLEQPR